MAVIDIRHFTWKMSDKRGVYETAIMRVGKHRIEVTASPTGRSVHVHVDGERVLGGRNVEVEQ